MIVHLRGNSAEKNKLWADALLGNNVQAEYLCTLQG